MKNLIRTILIVDDDIFIRQSFADYFEDNLWNTLLAKSGEEALKILEKESPDGAIVDIRMSGMDGNAFIRKAHLKKQKMVFIIYTGSPEYHIPSDIQKLPNVSKKLFRKPLFDTGEIKNELNTLIQDINTRR